MVIFYNYIELTFRRKNVILLFLFFHDKTLLKYCEKTFIKNLKS